MNLHIAKLGSESDEDSLFSIMCVKYDAKASILPVWLSPEYAELEVPKFSPEEFRIEKLDWEEYGKLADQHQKMGINLFLHVRRPEAETEPEEADS